MLSEMNVTNVMCSIGSVARPVATTGRAWSKPSSPRPLRKRPVSQTPDGFWIESPEAIRFYREAIRVFEHEISKIARVRVIIHAIDSKNPVDDT